MSFQTFVTQRLAAITALINAIGSNAKKIDELPVQSVLDPSSKIHVSKQGDSESLEVQKIIDSIKLNTYNQILFVDEIVVISNEATIPTGLRWKINEIYFETLDDIVKAVPYCATGLNRTDILIANALGGVDIIYGLETDSIAVRPNIPLDTVLITPINVTDNSFGDIIPPIIGDNFIPKLPVMVNQRLIAYVKDDGTIGRLLPQAYPNLDELAFVKGVTAPIQTQIDDTLTASNAYTDSKVSAVYKIKGSVANYASLPSTGQVVGDVWNLLDTGANYVWTGTDWDKLGDTVDVSGKENTSNKTDTVTGNETSTSLYLNILGAVTYFQEKLTDSNFGTFSNGLTSKATPLDADSISIVDSADSNKAKKTTFAQLKAFYKTYFDTQYIAVSTVKVPKTYFVNTATGDNATGVYEDASKPFASIDYVNANFTIQDNDIFYLQGTGQTYAINGQLQAKKQSFRADSGSTNILDFSSNANTNAMVAGGSDNIVTIDMPNGVLRCERSGGTGVIFGGTVPLEINVKEIYWNTSTKLSTKGNFLCEVQADKISSRVSDLFQFIGNDIIVQEFVCLAAGAGLVSYGKSAKINLISGSGSFALNSNNDTTLFVRYIIGDVIATGGINFGVYLGGIDVTFDNSSITTFSLAGSPPFKIIKGNIRSITTVSGNLSNAKFINFTANLGNGNMTLGASNATVSFENCSIKSTNSPIIITAGAFSNVLELKNSTFEVVNAVPLVTGGAGGTNTLKIAGVSTNATMLSDQNGTGVTVTVLAKQSVANGVNPKDAVNKEQLDAAVIGGGGATNLSYTASPTNGTVVSDTGTDATIPLADATNAGLLKPAKYTVLENTSNTNTGDETAPSIITKIGDGTKINQSYLPSYVDDILEFSDLASFPITGEIGKIYIAISPSNIQYRWSGSAYIAITNGLIASTNEVPEGISNLYFTTARVLSTVLTGVSFLTGGAIVSTDSVLVAFGKLQKQITDLLATGSRLIESGEITKLSKYPSTATNGKILQGNGTNYVEVDAPTSPTTIVGITGTKAQYDTSVTDGNFMYVGDAPTAHNHTASEVTDFNSATRAQTEAELVAGTNITITPSGTGATRQLTIASTGGGATPQTGQIIVTSGTSFTTPSTITTNTVFNIELVGGGGGGGGSASLTGGSKGSAGGGGAYCFVRLTGLNPSTTYTCNIGTAGAGGAATFNGTSGTATTLTISGTTYTANGGGGGIATASSDGGVGGTATNGNINITGQKGADSVTASAAAIGAVGGNTAKGWGNGGNGVRSGQAGSNATGYGAGGAGGHASVGGNGTQGIIFAQWYN